MFSTRLILSHRKFQELNSEVESLLSSINCKNVSVEILEIYGRIEIRFFSTLKHKEEVVRKIKAFIIYAVCVAEKKKYISNKISNYKCSFTPQQYSLLINSLVVFDRERDETILRLMLNLTDEFSLDGFIAFRISSLKERWEECVNLVKENYALLYAQKTYDLFLRFVLSTAEPKSEVVRIFQTEKGYIVKANFQLPITLSFENDIRMMEKLIEIAPVTIFVFGDNNIMLNTLSGLFEVKTVNKKLINGKKFT